MWTHVTLYNGVVNELTYRTLSQQPNPVQRDSTPVSHPQGYRKTGQQQKQQPWCDSSTSKGVKVRRGKDGVSAVRSPGQDFQPINIMCYITHRIISTRKKLKAGKEREQSNKTSARCLTVLFRSSWFHLYKITLKLSWLFPIFLLLNTMSSLHLLLSKSGCLNKSCTKSNTFPYQMKTGLNLGSALLSHPTVVYKFKVQKGFSAVLIFPPRKEKLCLESSVCSNAKQKLDLLCRLQRPRVRYRQNHYLKRGIKVTWSSQFGFAGPCPPTSWHFVFKGTIFNIRVSSSSPSWCCGPACKR